MKNMNMKVKLILSFFVIVAINICFGLYSLYSLYIVNGRVVEANSWTDGISQLADMQFGVISLRRDDLNYTLQTDDVQKKNTLLHRETSIKNAEEVMNAYKYDVETIPYDTEEQRQEDMNAINLIIDNWKAYLAVSQKLLDESDSNNETNVMALINGESQTSFEELENSVVDLVVYNQEGCAAVMVMSEEIYQKTVRVILGILLVIAVFSVTVPVLMVRGIRRSIGELLRVSKAIGEGDLTVTARIFANDEFGELAGRYNQMIAHIKSLVSHMQNSAAFVAGSARDFHESASQSSAGTDLITQRIEQVSALSDRQRTEIEAIMASINDMVENIANMAEKLDSMEHGAAESVRISKEGGESMQKAISQMKMIESAVNTSSDVVTVLGERSNEIGLIVGTIATISSQTNLLALNASIEAARAGEQGRGFAVVAGEVKKLAGESRAAAEEISRLISSIQEETSHAIEVMLNGKEEAREGGFAVDNGGHAFDELAKRSVQSSDGLTSIAATMREMSSETARIASAVRNVEDSGREMAKDSQSIASATQQQSITMSEVSNSSQNLTNVASEMLDSAKSFIV